MPSWFTDLTGLRSDDPDTVRRGIEVQGDDLVMKASGRRLHAGRLTTPNLTELGFAPAPGQLRLSEVVADARALHEDPANAGAAFQVASQFNLLEMVSPSVTPEHGIAGYASDPTQGPACAMACAAGTIWRNYLVPVGDQIGQSRDRQIDTLADLHITLRGDGPPLWTMRNGYVTVDASGLDRTRRAMAAHDRTTLKSLIRIGVQEDTEVTGAPTRHRVTQLYCSALPIAYGTVENALWEPFARLVLEAAYEASLAAALRNAATTGVRRLYLTRLGGGAFGNPGAWIDDAIANAFARFAGNDLDVAIVSYRAPNPANRALLVRLGQTLP